MKNKKKAKGGGVGRCGFSTDGGEVE